MITKVQVKCPDCGHLYYGNYDTVDHSLTSTCPSCSKRVNWIVGLEFHIGRALIGYSSHVLEEDNTNLSILFSAMAIDCYLSRLYSKSRNIEELLSNRPYEPNNVREMIQEELIGIRYFLDKIKRVESFLHPAGIADFIHAYPNLEKEIQTNFPDIRIDNFAEDIRNDVMWKRNSIIHADQVKYTKSEANKALEHAKRFITVFEHMDEAKSKTVI